MFRKSQRRIPELTPAIGAQGSPWDPDTLAWLAAKTQLAMLITQVDQTLFFGRERKEDRPIAPEATASGHLLQAPQHVHAALKFGEDIEEGTGWGTLSQYDYKMHRSQRVSLPLLEVIVCDPGGDIRQAVVNAIQSSASTDRNEAVFEFWPTFEPGWERGRSGGRSIHYRLGIERCFVRSRLRRPGSPEWEALIGDGDVWTLDDFPHPERLRAYRT